MISFKVSDEIGATPSLPVLEWSWGDTQSCSVRMVIEERIRTECERVANRIPASEFLAEISDGLDGYTDQIIKRAFAAFDGGKLILIINDKQVSDLDEPIPIRKANEAVFLKLLPLRGG